MQALSCVVPSYNTEAIRMGWESFTHFQRDMREDSFFLRHQSEVRRFIAEIEGGTSEEALVEKCRCFLSEAELGTAFQREGCGYRLRELFPFQRELLCERFVSLCRRICAEADLVYGFETFYAVLMTFLALFAGQTSALDPSDHFANLLLELAANETPEACFVNSILAE
ncbi:MAG: hypothetical protein J6D37_03605 [Clostridia bacterium]|nr:hypothetical protein [Clostridia bacterium]